MNFIEAYEAVRVRKEARGAKNLRSGDITYFPGEMGCLYPLNAILAQYELVAPTPQTEDVEVKRWECDKCGSIPRNEYSTEPDKCDLCGCSNFIELRGIKRKPLPRKVVKEWTFNGVFGPIKEALQCACNVPRQDRPAWVANTQGVFTYRAEVEE